MEPKVRKRQSLACGVHIPRKGRGRIYISNSEGMLYRKEDLVLRNSEFFRENNNKYHRFRSVYNSLLMNRFSKTQKKLIKNYYLL